MTHCLNEQRERFPEHALETSPGTGCPAHCSAACHWWKNAHGISLRERAVKLPGLLTIHQHHLRHLYGNVKVVDKSFNGGPFVQDHFGLAAGRARGQEFTQIGKEFDLNLHLTCPFRSLGWVWA